MKKPSIATMVSVAEIISSLAIVISLIYVGYEYKRSEIMTNRDVDNIMYQRVMELERLVIENSELAGIIVKAGSPTDTLSDEEMLRYLAYEHIFYDGWETLWAYRQEEIVDEDLWDGWNKWFIEESRRKPEKGWTGNRKHFNGDFLKFVDEIRKQ